MKKKSSRTRQRPLSDILTIVVLLFAMMAMITSAQAQDLPATQRTEGLGELRPLASADDVRGWRAVGRLDTGQSFCSATLIEEGLVLTAAHCLFDPETGERIADARLSFQAGLRNGRADAYRSVRQSYVPEGYSIQSGADFEMIGLDLALLELDHPVRMPSIPPIPAGRDATPETEVTVVSYGAGRETMASIEEDCLILAGRDTVRMLSCDVAQGSSGAPILRLGDAGPEVIGVMSAGAEHDGDDVALGVALDGTLAPLLDQRDRRGSAFGRSGGALNSVGLGNDGRDRIGARFLRP